MPQSTAFLSEEITNFLGEIGFKTFVFLSYKVFVKYVSFLRGCFIYMY